LAVLGETAPKADRYCCEMVPVASMKKKSSTASSAPMALREFCEFLWLLSLR
jgi:hypothetical protein